jgi:hypothetical protein
MGVEMLLSTSQWPPLTWERASQYLVENPVLAGIPYIMVVAAGADTVNDEGADLLDAGEVGCFAHFGVVIK